MRFIAGETLTFTLRHFCKWKLPNIQKEGGAVERLMIDEVCFEAGKFGLEQELWILKNKKFNRFVIFFIFGGGLENL